MQKKTQWQSAKEKLEAIQKQGMETYLKALSACLFLLHHVDLALEVYFFITVPAQYLGFALAHLFFIILPYAIVIIKNWSRAKPTEKIKSFLIIDLLAINNIWDSTLGFFPCVKSANYMKHNYAKRMVFYVAMDLPLLTLKVFNNLLTGNTFSSL